MHVRRLAGSARPLVVAILAASIMSACVSTPAPTPATTAVVALPTSAAPATAIAAATPSIAPTQSPSAVPVVPATATPMPPTPTLVPQQIAIDSPPPGTLVGSPVVLTGRVARVPSGGALAYRVVTASGQDVGSGPVPVSGAATGSGTFNVSLNFALPPNGGDLRVELVDRAAEGTVVASAALGLYVQSQSQTITINTPPPQTQVGSPVVLTGQLARTPFQNRLDYIVTNSSRQQIGGGVFDVAGVPGRPTGFTGSLNFSPPLNGDTITVQVYDQDTTTGAIVASQTINLTVAPTPQQILIDTPPSGTVVGTPMVVTGRTVRFPFNGTLSYRFTDANNQQIGAGTFVVLGNVSSGTTFNVQVAFNPPHDGGTVRLTIYDQNPADGSIVVSSALDVEVLPQYQAIFIDTPAPGTTVGSPVVITGRTNLVPDRGQLRYRVLDDRNTQIGAGTFPIDVTSNRRGRFSAALTFAEPANGGGVRVELSDVADNGALLATNQIALAAAPPPPPQIFIDTPPPGVQVGSPVVLTGRATYAPANGHLAYRVTDERGTTIGQGSVPLAIDGRRATFNAALTFNEPLRGGNILVTLIGVSPIGGAPPITTAITLFVVPRAQPR